MQRKRRNKFPRFLLGFTIGLLLLLLFGLFFCSPFYKQTFFPRTYSEYVNKYAAEYDVDPNLIFAVIKTESGFHPEAVSNVGARGLMQLMEDTYEWIKFRMNDERNITYEDMWIPEYNIQYGAYLLKLLDEEYQETETIIAAYHAGRGMVNNWLSQSEYSQNGHQFIKIPSRSTAHYIRKVMSNYESYTNLYGSPQ